MKEGEQDLELEGWRQPGEEKAWQGENGPQKVWPAATSVVKQDRELISCGLKPASDLLCCFCTLNGRGKEVEKERACARTGQAC